MILIRAVLRKEVEKLHSQAVKSKAALEMEQYYADISKNELKEMGIEKAALEEDKHNLLIKVCCLLSNMNILFLASFLSHIFAF